MPRLVKGSQEAKDFMASIRSKRTGKPRVGGGRFVKGSQEAKDYMASLRMMKKK